METSTAHIPDAPETLYSMDDGYPHHWEWLSVALFVCMIIGLIVFILKRKKRKGVKSMPRFVNIFAIYYYIVLCIGLSVSLSELPHFLNEPETLTHNRGTTAGFMARGLETIAIGLVAVTPLAILTSVIDFIGRWISARKKKKT